MTLCIIPARLDSSRFPRKVLTSIAGRELILRVIDTCVSCDRLTRIVVLAHDQEICDVVSKEFGSENRVFVNLHTTGCSGTHRAFDYYYNYISDQNSKTSMVVVQADNIGLTTNDLDMVVLYGNYSLEKAVYTPVCKMIAEEAASPSNVKAVVANFDNILYFSRSLVPYNSSTYYKHIGVYMFTKSLLEDHMFKMYANNNYFNCCTIMKDENLEQLAWLYYGFKMCAVQLLGYRDSIDTPDDMERYIRRVYSKQ